MEIGGIHVDEKWEKADIFFPKLDFHSWELLPQQVTAGNAEHGANRLRQGNYLPGRILR